MNPESIYTQPGPMTSPGKHTDFFRTLPRELPALARAIQGVQIHEYMLEGYGVKNAPEVRKLESHLRPLEHMLGAVRARDDRPLDVAREPAERLIGVCRHFAVWFVGALRQQGIPARVRWGFATYFNPSGYEDHIIGEYWSVQEKRWILVDPQLDEHQRKLLKIDFDPLDVPHDRFIAASEIWRRCRAGEIDPAKVGITPAGAHGLWFVTGSLIREVASLNAMELAAWDTWGAMARQNSTLTSDELAFFDRLAKLTAAPDEHLREIRDLFEKDSRVRPGETVFNARRMVEEKVEAPPAGVKLA